MVSYIVSYRTAQAGKSQTIAENFIKPCVTDIVGCMSDEKSSKQINTISLSNGTVNVEYTMYHILNSIIFLCK
jgi:hypothetical protein